MMVKNFEDITERSYLASGVPLGTREPPRILVLEDDSAIRLLISTFLDTLGHQCSAVASVQDALRLTSKQYFDIVVADVSLPDGSCFDLLDAVNNPESVAIVVTGHADLNVAVEAMGKGAVDLVKKPFTIERLKESVEKAESVWRARHGIRKYSRALETLVEIKAEELSRSTKHITEIHDLTVSALGAALNLKDNETAGHCDRVSRNCVTLGALLDLSDFELQNLKWGAYLHDVGKIGVPESILLKPGPLTIGERTIMQRHPSMGHDMIRSIQFLHFAADVILSHHENYDGTGYPHGLRGVNIPINARIFSIIDTLDAMTSNRPYRAALPFSAAVSEVNAKAHAQFDPEIAAAFVSIPKETWLLQRNGGDV